MLATDNALTCPACGSEMITDGVDTADGLEFCHRCPKCRLVIVCPAEGRNRPICSE
ncbi:MAG: hypothetical protein LH475_10835 [Cryobacterium sp.]|uniref:hypothetical protein n=1 Tax=unclassified Cryobacterium TaxID=2649013 RepID=UPI0018CB96E6|nr:MULTISPECIES: hypothetical protein [unclassified Cryobacterium]MCY7405101.1 hypothetical protein [Cryobacterium sp.]MEC5155250.1 Zn-finger nucleic acid-binding protein [Cryobacterium sp. CAN_C3]